MKNLLVLLSFLVGIGFLIAWLWSDTSEDKTLKQIVTQAENQENTGKKTKTKGKVENSKVAVRSNTSLSDVEISDDNGLVIVKLYGKKINQRVTENPVKDIQVYDGVLTFSEKKDGHWNFKAVNLEQYINQYLKK